MRAAAADRPSIAPLPDGNHSTRQDDTDVVASARPSELLTITEVMRRLKIGRSTAYQLCQEGVLPVVKIGSGRLVRVSAAALDDFIRQNTR